MNVNDGFISVFYHMHRYTSVKDFRLFPLSTQDDLSTILPFRSTAVKKFLYAVSGDRPFRQDIFKYEEIPVSFLISFRCGHSTTIWYGVFNFGTKTGGKYIFFFFIIFYNH